MTRRDRPTTRSSSAPGSAGRSTACRLAEAGYRVLVLERGRRWAAADFPREPGDAWRWDDGHPEREQRLDRLPDLPFDGGRPGSGGRRRLAHLRQHQHRGDARHVRGRLAAGGHLPGAGAALRGGRPDDERPARAARAMAGADGADARGRDGDRPRPTASGRSTWPSTSTRAGTRPPTTGCDPARSRRFTNAEGIEQGTCVHLGECDIGCPVLARNTLDLNYLPRAEHHGAEVRPLHVVRAIERERRRLPRPVRPDRGRPARARDRVGPDRGRRRGLARLDRPPAALPRRRRRRCPTCPPRSAEAGAATATS